MPKRPMDGASSLGANRRPEDGNAIVVMMHMGSKKPTSAESADDYCQLIRHVFRRNQHFAWNGKHYQHIDDMMMHRVVSEFISSAEPSAASSTMVKNVVETIAQKTAVPSEPPEPMWVDGLPAENQLTFENGVLLLNQFIEDQLNVPALLPAP